MCSANFNLMHTVQYFIAHMCTGLLTCMAPTTCCTLTQPGRMKNAVSLPMLGQSQCCRNMVFSRYRLYRDMSKTSRYSIAIFLSIFIEQLFINNHTIFIQIEAAMLLWRHKKKHKMLYGTGEGRPARGGGGGRKETLYQLVYIYLYT